MWQPIETAPRDATAILVMRDIWPGARSGRAEECNGRNTYVASWWPDERGGHGAWICYMDAVLDPECPVEPTHWMPLPALPGAQPAPSIPEGWKLVPIEPTPKMMRVAQKADHEGWLEYDGEDVKRVYRAMLAAAPEAKP